jgi:hypothetical protein
MKIQLNKMQTKLIDSNAFYYIDQLCINDLVGKKLSLIFKHVINCQGCKKEIRKSYAQGYCYPCMMKLPQCDICMVRPEKCHYQSGTCRDEKWAEIHCFKPHYVYLANSSNLKVGITKEVNIPHRWRDQGATQALPIMKVPNRLASGKVESFLAEHYADKTNWREMLKGNSVDLDLLSIRDDLFSEFGEVLEDLEGEIDEMERGGAVEFMEDSKIVFINYPVLEYPTKVSSLSFDKSSHIEGTLLGIKGQYLIFDTGVLNIRKFSGYSVEVQYE